MFTRFGNVGARRERRRWVTLTSVAGHAALAWLAAVATVRGDSHTPPPEPVREVHYVAPAPAQLELPTPERRATDDGRPAANRAPTLPVVSPPSFVPPELPPIDLTVAGTVGLAAELARGPGAPAGPSTRPDGSPAPGSVWEGHRVEVAAAPRPGNPPPRYPAALAQSGVTGRVIARFVVDTTGRVEPRSVQIAASDDDLFSAAVRAVLGRYRFDPARVQRRPVRQLVEMPFVFDLGPAAR